MQVLTDELRGLEDVISRDDVYVRVNGPEKLGRVRMLGRGITQQDVFEEIPSRKAYFRMFQTLQERLDKLEHSKNDVTTPSGPSSSSYKDKSSTRISTNDPRPLWIHFSVSLMSVIGRNKIVAKGYLKSMDPNTKVVHINVAVKGDEDLVRPYMHFSTTMDAQGVSVAWPKSLVSFRLYIWFLNLTVSMRMSISMLF
ncbi:hypothetical protein CDL12_12564 [Handroanthus impetiginosus]|uniref:Uncharacterized protein n=1 Tax=Handroanthus impetiginosus TaxID=429701 RepID=A0A2G9HBB4_9LAMI|nr:hypothetical protein CDL12_12564 [Handroanthus impetiginosus]